jgi:ElaB/YqjD/DUF883 family membrane-anchored ribosome-binding protein
MSANSDDKRQEIKDRIEAARARHEEREGEPLPEMLARKAAEARDEFTAFAKEHPVATVAGGLALGVLISAMFSNSPTRRAGRYAGAKAAGLASIGVEMAAAFAQQVMESANTARQAGGDLAEDLGDKVGDTARRVRREAQYRAGGAGDAARSTAREIGKSIALR